jgi:replicative DNA helicase
MGAHVELHLLSKIIDDGELKDVLDEGITVDMFGQPEARMVYERLLTYFRSSSTRNLVMDWDLVDKKFPTVQFPEPSNRLSAKALAIEVKKDWLRRRLAQAMEHLEETVDDDPEGALASLSLECKGLQSSSDSSSRDVILSNSMEEVWNEYQMAKNTDGYLGIPFPIGWGYHTDGGKPKMIKKTGRQDHPLNEQSRGMQKGDFILLYGRPKSMKTWLLIDTAVECYQHHRCRTLIFTKEMTPEQLRTRFVARMLGVDYMEFRNGQLEPREEEEFLDLVQHIREEEDRLKKKSSLLFTTGWTGGVMGGIASLQAKIEEFEPDVVFADSVYLMEVVKKHGGSQWQDIKEIAYGLAKLASDYRIPIFATSQANRKGEETKGSTMAEIAYGDTFAQACHLAIRVIKREMDDGSVDLACIISGARELKLPGFLLEAEPAKYFRLKQVFESQRQIQAQFKAEEEAMAREEEIASKKVRQDRNMKYRFDSRKIRQKKPSDE